MSAYKDDVPKSKHFVLKSKIKGMAAMGADIRQKIVKKKREEPSSEDRSAKVIGLRLLKQGVGIDQRHHLIAYGLLRGLPYDRIESKVSEDNKPSTELVFKVIQEHVTSYAQKEWTRERITKLMTREDTEKKAA